MFDRHSIRVRIALIIVIPVLLILGGFSIFLNHQIRTINASDATEGLRRTNQQIVSMAAQTEAIFLKQADSWARVLSASLSGTFSLELASDSAQLKLNGLPLNGSTREVDAFSLANPGNTASIFARQGETFVRIATSLKDDASGLRAVGFLMGSDHPAYAALLAGEPYLSRTTRQGKTLMMRYDPIKDEVGSIIGCLVIEFDLTEEMENIKSFIRKIVAGKTGYSYVLDSKPGADAGTLLVHPVSEGGNIAESKDAGGRFFIKEILEKRNGVILYPWINKSIGETSAREKIVVFDEYKDWGWIIASGSYTEEIFHLAAQVSKLVLAASAVAALLLLGILSFYLNRLVVAPLHLLVSDSRRIAAGDLSVQVEMLRKDEIGQVLIAMQQMVDKFRNVITEILRLAATISSASEQLSIATASVSQSVEEQAQATASSSAALEEVTASINEVTSLAKITEDGATLTVGLANESVAAIRQAVAEIELMASSVASASNQVGSLLKRSEEIGGIANVIREIADQTNLLALNAAIEAARAGEQGRGFAVVADEVRKLAERTTQATRQIAEVIGQIQQETQQTVISMQEVTPRIQGGLAQVNGVSGMLDHISEEAKESQRRALEVSHATSEQALATNDIARSVEHVVQMTEATSETMKHNAESAVQLQETAKVLRQQVSYFKVD